MARKGGETAEGRRNVCRGVAVGVEGHVLGTEKRDSIARAQLAGRGRGCIEAGAV